MLSETVEGPIVDEVFVESISVNESIFYLVEIGIWF